MTILVELGLFFSLLSLLSVGGMPSVIPEMHRYVVEQKSWISHTDFMEMFALGQAAPGPNVLITSLIGWKIAGVPGAFVTLIAMCGPAAVLSYWVAGVWERKKDAPWRAIAHRELAVDALGKLAARLRDARQGIEHARLEEAEVDEGNARGEIDLHVVRHHGLVGVVDRHEPDAEARALRARAGCRCCGGLVVVLPAFAVGHRNSLGDRWNIRG